MFVHAAVLDELQWRDALLAGEAGRNGDASAGLSHLPRRDCRCHELPGRTGDVCIGCFWLRTGRSLHPRVSLAVSPEDSQSDASYPEIDTRKTFIHSLIGMRIAGRYEVSKILGEGGMGVVAQARHTELEQDVAIKFMFPEFLGNEVLSARFAREAKLAAKVQSPHIVRVSDVGRLPSGVPYLVMDLLTGRDLGDELDERGVFPVERAVDYVLQACAGIAALHAIGVVHRDLKPSNLFVADIAGVPTVKVLDFGISKDVTTPSASLTSTETQLGTPMYMSPEQIRASKNVDMRSDVWSLGVILYELLTGSLPFERSGHSVGELFAVILMTEPVPLCMRRPELPMALEDVVMRCLRRSSWDRYDSVAALAEALRPFTRPTSLHRIDSVRRALGTAEPSVDFAADPARSEQPTVNGSPRGRALSPVAQGASVVSVAPTLSVEQAAQEVRLEVDSNALPAPRRVASAQASPSLVSSSRAISATGESGEPSTTSRRSGLMWALGIAAAVIGAAGTFAVRASSSSSPDVDTATASPAPAAPPPPVATTGTPTSAPAVAPPPPLVVATETATPVLPPLIPHVAPTAAKAPAVVAHPAAHGAATAPSPPPSTAPRASAAPPKVPGNDELILDRK
jgi:eukaryotic-like serine/threonine-protein kinase